MVHYSGSDAILALFLFLAAGVCEIAGVWFIWKWRREGSHWIFFPVGCLILIAFGLIPTLQKQTFSRTFAAYGGFFILLSLFWGWALDGSKPDLWDGVGAAIAIVGVCLIMFVPRN